MRKKFCITCFVFGMVSLLFLLLDLLVYNSHAPLFSSSFDIGFFSVIASVAIFPISIFFNTVFSILILIKRDRIENIHIILWLIGITASILPIFWWMNNFAFL